jgi:macrolide transport system ATP-binding/permease protein
VQGGDRLLVTGPNGAGKSTLLKLLAGHLAPTFGDLHVHPGARITFLSQEVPQWPTELTAHEIHRRHVDALRSCGLIRTESSAASLTGSGLLEPRAARTPVGQLSEGQQRRLHLALCLAEQPDLILLDEPTNHLSAVLVDELTIAVRETDMAVIIATHDRQMLQDLSAWPVLELAPS